MDAHLTPVHHIDPVALELGPLAIRWYGLAYVAGFVAMVLVLRFLAARRLTLIPKSEVIDFVTYAAIFGVMLGGRLGYVFLYDPSLLWPQPWRVFAIWDGGMASHGGIFGLMVFTLWYAWRRGLAWTHVGDSLVVGAPIGICLGRVANFINGELYGRVAPSLSWGMKFPGELLNGDLPAAKARQAWGSVQAHSPDLAVGDGPALLARLRDDPSLREALAPFLQTRHPSQLYQAALEGGVLFLFLLVLRLRFPRLSDGVLTAAFFIGYGGFRIFGEAFREPDSSLIHGLTRGQFYSAIMIVVGLLFLGFALVRRRSSLANTY